MRARYHLHYQSLVIKKIITWNFSVFESQNLGYDMVIGRDINVVTRTNNESESDGTTTTTRASGAADLTAGPHEQEVSTKTKDNKETERTYTNLNETTTINHPTVTTTGSGADTGEETVEYTYRGGAKHHPCRFPRFHFHFRFKH